MKTSEAAGYLNTYLTTRLDHPLHFESHDEMADVITKVDSWMGSKYPQLRDSPFVTAVLSAHNPNLSSEGAQVDNFFLFHKCLAYLSMTPIDDISPAAVTVFSKLAELEATHDDKPRIVNLLANLIIRADELDPVDRQALKQNCGAAGSALRNQGFYSKEAEQAISKHVSRDHGREFVKLLGFDIHNIPSLRNEAAKLDRTPATAMNL